MRKFEFDKEKITRGEQQEHIVEVYGLNGPFTN